MDRIEFVDTIAPFATVRMSLSAEPWRVLVNGTDASPPPFRRATVSTLMTDGARITAGGHDNRVVRLRLQLRSKDANVLATQVQRLHKELNRDTNFLRWQPDPDIPPVYFKTFRAPDYESVVDHGTGLYEAVIEIPAEPYAYGHRVDVNGGLEIQINNNPTAASNGKYFDVPNVLGDVETPLLIKGYGDQVAYRQTIFARRSIAPVTRHPFYVQAEAFILSVDAALQTGTSFSGSGNTGVRINPVITTALEERIYVNAGLPGATGVDLRGTYRVFVRYRVNGVGAKWNIQLRHGNFADRVNTSAQASHMANGAPPLMADLGLVQIPSGYDPVTDGPTGTVLPVTGIDAAIFASRTAGGGTLDLDYVLLVPADENFCSVYWGGTVLPYPELIVLDGYTRTIYSVDASGQIPDTAIGYVQGDFPSVLPGVTNRFVAIRETLPLPSFDDPVNSNWSLFVYYWPRYLTVRSVQG